MVVAPPGLVAFKGYHAIRSLGEADRPGRYLLELQAAAPEPSFALVRWAADRAVAGELAGIVTGPVTKAKWLAAGIPYPGHTDFLAAHAGASRCAMFFWSPGLRVLLHTTHLVK